jgi:hypothetical protein
VVQDQNIYESQWEKSSEAMSILENRQYTMLNDGIPYGIALGNHDVTNSQPGESEYFNKYFGINRFSNRSYYGGHYGDTNDNHYILFSAGSINFIAIFIEWHKDPTSDRFKSILSWAKAILNEYSDRQAIIIAHSIIYWDLNSFSRQGVALYNGIKEHTNAFLMLSGHVYPGEKLISNIYDGRTIHTLLSNYQHYSNGGNGFLRIMEFSPRNKKISVKTYSPYINEYETDENSQFSIPWDPWISIPTKFYISNNYPNPFNPITTIDYNLPLDSHVNIKIYDIFGGEVITLINASYLPAGYHTIQWDSKDKEGIKMPSGIYFYRIVTEGYINTNKMILLK